MVSFVILFVLVDVVCGHLNLVWDPKNPAFDPSIYENAIDSELCENQLELIRNNTLLRLRFLESGARIPRGFLQGNTLDMGDYHQCIGIKEVLEDSVVQGKYCMMQGPIQTVTALSQITQDNIDIEEIFRDVEKYELPKEDLKLLSGTGNEMLRLPGTPWESTELRFAVCVPKSCTSSQGINGLLFNTSELGQFKENYCRLSDDKPWVPVDYVAVIVFSTIGLITIISTSYDVWQTRIRGKGPKETSTIFKSFSVYTNAIRLTTFTSGPGSLECIDGIRALAMAWVIMGHTFTSQAHWINPIDTFMFSSELSSLWLTGAHITVDTFFFLSGLLVVYTTAGKLTGMKLLKNLHLFYLNRLLRMFPILAAGILFEASIAHRVSDGPDWQTVAWQANRCRTMWWTTLLHVQNYVSAENVCIGQSWYLAIDVQLHIISPIVLIWVVGTKRFKAWSALIAGLLASLVLATVYNFMKDFPSSMMTPRRGDEMMYYMVYYYMNTLTRGSPFFVGMIFGYLLHKWKGNKLKIPMPVVGLLWLFILVLTSVVMYASYLPLQIDWDNQVVDTLINSFQRPIWGVVLGWIIIACVHGYAGPVNWFLSLNIWKLPARVSYAMYIFHYSIMTIIVGSRVAPLYFTVPAVLYEFMAQFVLCFIVSFIVTLIIDSPFSLLFKLLLGSSGPRKTQKPTENDSLKEPQTMSSEGLENGGFTADEEKRKHSQ